MDTTRSEDASSPEDGALEAHRAMARELNERTARAYGLGGLGALVAAGAPILMAGATGQLARALPWVLAITLFLIALFFVRALVRRTGARLRQRLERYCEANGVAADALVDYYEGRQDYTFLSALRAPDQEPPT